MALLAQAEGAVAHLHGDFMTYTNQTKARRISGRLLKEQGTVNRDVAKQLAASALECSPVTIAIRDRHQWRAWSDAR